MAIRKMIFDSTTEKNIFDDLIHKWNNKITALPHIPFKDVIDIQSKYIKQVEREKFLLKTNFDFVVVSNQKVNFGEPILAIEFDGWGHGFSNNGEYIEINKTKDPYRKLKLDCKIRICEQEGFPLVVVSYQEIEKVVKDQLFTILDEIIGQVLSNKEFVVTLNEEANKVGDSIKNTDSNTAQMIIDDYVIDKEACSQINNNPIVQKICVLQDKVIMNKVIGEWGCKPVDEGSYTGWEYYGKVLIKDKKIINKKVLIRQVNCKGVSECTIAKDLAEFAFWSEIASKYID